MIKLYKKEELKNITQYSKELIQEIEKIIDVLDENYGMNRDVDKDLGGYILIAESKEDIADIKANIINGLLIEEYTDVIKSDDGNDYYSSLFLLSSDYSVVVISTKELHELLLERKL